VICGVPTASLAGVPRRTAMIEGLGQGFRSDGGWKRRLLSGLLPRLYRAALAHAHVVFFLNDDDVADFRALGILRPDHHVVKLPGIGVDLQHYVEAPQPDGPPTFLMVARLLRDKGVLEYARAARRVREVFPEARFHLLGPPDPTPAGVPVDEVRALTDVTWLGETSDVRPYLAACHAFVLPTWYLEGLPRSILEALATGRAVVTTTIRGARDTVVDGSNGHLVPPKDADALADALLDLLRHPDRFATMGHASRRLAEARFEVGAVNRRIRDALLGG
jgi:glycosyltransferase involved in cell wall biosynthesis